MELSTIADESGLCFEYLGPIASGQEVADANPPWMEELRCFRGRYLLRDPDRPEAGTVRPKPDRDGFDPEYHHLLARWRSRLVGCIRLSPILSRGQVQDYLLSLGCPPVDEGTLASLASPTVCGRWIVEPSWRATGLGIRLAAGVHVLARRIGGSEILAMAGTKLGQDRILARIGARPFGEIGAFHAGHYGPVRLLRFNPWQVPKTFQGMLAGMECELDLAACHAAESILQAA